MPANVQPPKIINGWKEIATYLGKGVRSVQRYERELGLPVHRPAGRSKGSVIATKLELDGWVSASPIREAFRMPPPKVGNASLLTEFHRRMEELHRLRQEAAELRGELRMSLEVLRATIQALSVQRPLPYCPEGRLLTDALTFDPPKSKVH